MLEQRFDGLRDALRGADPADSQRLRDMLHDLNALLDRHARGEDTADAFAEFMRRHGEFFPEQPSNVDELIDALARRAAEGERLMRSLSPQQRQELAGLMESALGEAGIAGELAGAEPHAAVAAARTCPGVGARRYAASRGSGTARRPSVLGEISELDDLLEQLGQEHPGATLDDVDVDAVDRHLGRDAAADLRRLQELERELRRQGWLTLGPGGLTLSPKALRRLGGTALRTVFGDLEGSPARRARPADAGAAGELTGAVATPGSTATTSRSTWYARWATRYGARPRWPVAGRSVRSSWTSPTSRWRRPSGGPRPPWRSAWTCPSPWSWRGAGGR